MSRKPTHEEASTINDILNGVKWEGGAPSFEGTWREAVRLCYTLTGYSPPSTCTACRHNVHDRLRRAVGLSYARRPDPEMKAQRLALCHACPAYHKGTDSCGRFILDALSPKAVEVDGREILPCGCIVSLKAMFESETCPASRWQ